MLLFGVLSALWAGHVAAITSNHHPASLPFLNRNHEKASQVVGQCSLVRRPLDKQAISSTEIPFWMSVCPYSQGQLWLFCGDYPYSLAPDLCASYGWRVAMLTRENAVEISNLITNCTSVEDSVWLAGVHGLPADPCIFGTVDSNNSTIAFQGIGTSFCEDTELPVICEEIPKETITETATSVALTVTFGQTTTTATSLRTRTVRHFEPACSNCVKPKSSSSNSGATYEGSSSCDSSGDTYESSSYCGSSSDSSDSSSDAGHHHRLHKDALIQANNNKRIQGSQPICYGEDCLPVCNATFGGIHLITTQVNFTNAQAECAKYGWTLLDMTTSRSSALSSLALACSFTELFAFINSYNGVQSACSRVEMLPLTDSIVIPLVITQGDDTSCDQESSASSVLCQEQCPFDVSDSGLEVGQVSLTTTTTDVTNTLFTPSTTVVISEACTETIYSAWK